jgi:WD40 repeat protein
VERHNSPAVRTLTGNASPAHYLTFSPDGHTLAASSQDQYVRLWNAEDGTQLATLDAHNAPVNQLAFSSDGHLLAGASADGTALLWNLDPDQAQQRLCHALHGPDLAQQWSRLSNALGTPPC